MSAEVKDTQQQEQKNNDKELNFRALESKYKRELELAHLKAMELERALQEKSQIQTKEEDDDDAEPYVDHKKLEKKLSKLTEQTERKTQQHVQVAVQKAIAEEKKQNWLRNNPDFYEILQHAEKFAQKEPELAETILEMPEGFERQKLVYKNIKSLGLHKPEVKQSSIQEKIDSNRKSPYYQPSGVGTAPYAQVGDFSTTGQKQAYEKLQELKNRLRLS